MPDVFTKEKRSEIMQKIKSRGNKSTEIKLIKFFKENEIKGWRRTLKIFGKPDFAFPKQKIAIFLDGCFWHGHNCRNTKPQDNEAYWKAKIARNQTRDREVTKLLESKKWTVVRIWECELKNEENIREKLAPVLPQKQLQK